MILIDLILILIRFGLFGTLNCLLGLRVWEGLGIIGGGFRKLFRIKTQFLIH